MILNIFNKPRTSNRENRLGCVHMDTVYTHECLRPGAEPSPSLPNCAVVLRDRCALRDAVERGTAIVLCSAPCLGFVTHHRLAKGLRNDVAVVLAHEDHEVLVHAQDHELLELLVAEERIALRPPSARDQRSVGLVR